MKQFTPGEHVFYINRDNERRQGLVAMVQPHVGQTYVHFDGLDNDPHFWYTEDLTSSGNPFDLAAIK